MNNIIIGAFLGILLGIFFTIVVINIYRNKERKEFIELEREYEKFDELVFSLTDKKIIVSGTRYLVDIINNCVYVFKENEIIKYIPNKNCIFEEDKILNIPKDLLVFFENYISWNSFYGGMFGRAYIFFHRIKKK